MGVEMCCAVDGQSCSVTKHLPFDRGFTVKHGSGGHIYDYSSSLAHLSNTIYFSLREGSLTINSEIVLTQVFVNQVLVLSLCDNVNFSL